MITEVLVNGEPSDGSIPVTDSSVLRGDGCFEVLRSYQGHAFALEPHLDRLERSAKALEIPLPPRSDIASWIERIAADLGEGAVRVVVTRGSSVPGLDGAPNIVVFGHPWERVAIPGRLLPVVAPWHSAGVDWELAGAKVLSYAPNMAATRRARAEGFEDALLVTVDEVMLEGPTFSVAWVVEGTVETPGLDLGILDSITRRILLDGLGELGIHVVEGQWRLDRLRAADEVMVWSTIREVQPVVEVGRLRWDPGPVTTRLGEWFATVTG